MHNFATQVTLITALLLSTNAQSFYDPHLVSSHLGTPNIKIIKVVQPSVAGTAGPQAIVVLKEQLPYQGYALAHQLASVGKAATQYYGAAHPQYASGYPQALYIPHAPIYPGKLEQPHLFPVEAVRPPTSQITGTQVSVYDVNPSSPRPHLYNTKDLRESVASIPNPARDLTRPDIDVRSLNLTRAMNRVAAVDPRIVFPQRAQDVVEIIAPMREPRDAQIKRRYLDSIVQQLYRSITTYPQQYPQG